MRRTARRVKQGSKERAQTLRSRACLDQLATFERERRTVIAERPGARPPIAAPMCRKVGKAIVIQATAQVARWLVGKWIVCEQRAHGGRSLEQPLLKAQEPTVVSTLAERREPHLPIESRLVRLDELRLPVDRSRLPFEEIFAPLLSVLASLEA